MGPFGDEYELSFEDYLSPFAPSTSRDVGPIPALSWEDGPFAPAEVTEMPPATEVREVDSGRDLEAADSDHIPKASSSGAGGAAEQDEFAYDLPPSDNVLEVWKPKQKYGRTLYEEKTLTAPDRDESVAIEVPAWRFPGRTPSVALVFAGVHGTERNGVTVVNQLKGQLIKAAERGRRPEYTTVLIPELITARRWKDPVNPHPDDVRYVDVDGHPVEPNRNFPSPGESYTVARQRGLSRQDKAELLGPDKRPLCGDKVTHRMLAETRILIRLIEEENPVRAVSVHTHRVPGTRGDGPGIFVDPRAWPPKASADISLAAAMVEDAMRSLGATADRKLDLRGTDGKPLSHPFQGNFADDATDKIPKTPMLTVLYTSKRHPPGTSFGGWAPARGVTAITSELPQWRKVSSVVMNKLVNVHENAILRVFLGGLRAPGQTESNGESLETGSQPSTSQDAGPIPVLSWDGPFLSAEVIGMQPATWVGEVAQEEALGVESEDFVEREWESDGAGLRVTEASTPESSDREIVETYAELEAEMHLAGEPEVDAAEFQPETDFGVAESYAELEAEAYVDSEPLAESEDFVEPEWESDRQRGVVRRGAFVRCSGRGQPGAKALAAQWTRVSGIKAGVYNCRSTVFGTPSLHGEGRAIDCYANVNNPTQRAQAEAYIAWLQANAVELQVAVVIWNRRIWSWHRRQQGWRRYKGNPHTDHFHVELSWEGALKPSQLLATTLTKGGILALTSGPQTSSPAGTAPGAKLSLAEFEGGELERATWAGEDNGESTDGLSEPEFLDLYAEPEFLDLYAEPDRSELTDEYEGLGKYAGDQLHLVGAEFGQTSGEAESPFWLEPVRVSMAVAQGQRDENALTNLIFFSRHPELGGRRLRPEETGLMREWTAIRDSVVRPVLALTGKAALGSAGAAPKAPVVGQLGVLVASAPGVTEFRYQFTAEDALWTAKLVTLEAGGQRDGDNAAVIWAMFNRYALFTHRQFRTFTDFVRAYSTTLQPVLRNKGAATRHMNSPDFVRTGGFYPNSDIPRGQLRRHLQVQAQPWEAQSLAAARALILDALRGDLPNPGIGLASEFASTRIYWKTANRTTREPTEQEWRDYTERLAARHQPAWRWIGHVPGINQRKNAFFLDRRAWALPASAVQVIARGPG
jgi:hypothetical protein